MVFQDTLPAASLFPRARRTKKVGDEKDYPVSETSADPIGFVQGRWGEGIPIAEVKWAIAEATKLEQDLDHLIDPVMQQFDLGISEPIAAVPLVYGLTVLDGV